MATQQGDSGAGYLFVNENRYMIDWPVIGVHRGSSLSFTICSIDGQSSMSKQFGRWASQTMADWTSPVSLSFNASTDRDLFTFYNPDPNLGTVINCPASWSINKTNKQLRQTTNCHMDDNRQFGTHAIYTSLLGEEMPNGSNDSGFSDGRVSAHIYANDNDAAGLIIRWRDECNYYRFSIDETSHYGMGAHMRIVRVRDCSVTQLKKKSLSSTIPDFDWSDHHDLEFKAEGSQLFGYVDDVLRLEVADTSVDNAITAGRAGVYAWALGGSGTSVKYDNFTIKQL